MLLAMSQPGFIPENPVKLVKAEKRIRPNVVAAGKKTEPKDAVKQTKLAFG